jgi:hypothetical protein
MRAELKTETHDVSFPGLLSAVNGDGKSSDGSPHSSLRYAPTMIVHTSFDFLYNPPTSQIYLL